MAGRAVITHLFLDIGGVLLTDGWGSPSRRRAVKHFKLEPEFEERHRHAWDTHQLGKITLDEYLSYVVFYRKRPFTRARFHRYMLAQSQAYPKMIALAAHLKQRHGLKVAMVSNEGRELNAYRIAKFRLDALADVFVSSCYVGLIKPDPDFYRLAFDLTQTRPQRALYIENTPMFVEVSQGLGIRSILHSDYETTTARLKSFGLESGDSAVRRTRSS
jgi:putative hydrolase of the HAD superfamily